MMSSEDRERFDGLLESVLSSLPDRYRAVLEEVPLIVDDRPDDALLSSLRAEGVLDASDGPLDLCGLHSGVAETERSVEDGPVMPECVHIFREGIVAQADGWDGPDGEAGVREEIRITVLHEYGHHFGLDEDDLDALGYA